ncbi:MAG: methyltransferase domain-containing protein [Candidatus Nomurabacteria bacterium]|jgi:tellurite methyltransferase|nr:methyltransferase domain-containing protein [Candidatus Nomurabacteria bacterium]
MTSNASYQKQPKAWGSRPTPIVVQAVKLLSGGKERHFSALDIGAGQGRDSLYLAKQGFQVTALDKLAAGLSQIKASDERIETVAADMAQYEFEQKFDLIIAINVLHFLKKSEIESSIGKIKQATARGGLVVVSVLLDNHKLETQELKGYFEDFEIVLYREFVKDDAAHIGAQYPHTHQIAQLIARKRGTVDKTSPTC